MVKRIVAIAIVYLIAVVGWITLAGTITYRTDHQDADLKHEVGQLWGTPLDQKAPWASLTVDSITRTEKPNPANNGVVVVRAGAEPGKYELPIAQNEIRAGFELDQRQKGLLWYSTYRVRFSGDYVFENPHDKSGALTVNFAFPAANGHYDDFRFEIDGAAVPFTRQNISIIVATIPCAAKSRHRLAVNYNSQGLDRFVYRFGEGISEVRNFKLVATTNFDGYDHPANTISPVTKERAGNGWRLNWDYKDLIAGTGIGIKMPQKINPGPMAARISFFAPVSLGFFFFLIFVISLLRGIRLHPMNYFFLAAAFFAFHLLLAYLVDHISIHAAFALCSMVSIILVVSYMRIVAGNRFAFLEVAVAQLVYLIGFSYAFFFEGFTGLAVTIGSIITLFVVMQSTARIDWAQRFNLNGGTSAALEIKPSQHGC
ncbi:MAG TPA: inner membrane CreD family protein [Blastocatellia bacterium]|nr:inner membrane CreD family protein [Blastocatellia bacterium]